MIRVQEAIQIIQREKWLPGVEHVPLALSTQRFLAEDVIADSYIPPFDRVTMDGIAIQSAGFLSGTTIFNCSGIQRAGEKPHVLERPDHCLEVMTGSVLPAGADTIIPYEECSRIGSTFEVTKLQGGPGQNIHRRGSDRLPGDVLISAGKRIGIPEIGILASAGISIVRCFRNPRITLIATGDELVDVDQVPEPWQIRESNVHALRSMLVQHGMDAPIVRISDDRNQLIREISNLLEHNDCLLLSGGVSRGAYDLLPGVLEELGVNKLFHRVKQKPGKPFWFGRTESTFVFAFPGNPVSTLVCAVRYFLPWYQGLFGSRDERVPCAELTKRVKKNQDLTAFIPVRLAWNESKCLAYPLTGHGSGDYSILAEADAFLEIPEGMDHGEAGNSYPCFRFRFESF